MSTTYKHLKKVENNVAYKIQVDSAKRDSDGYDIATYYLKKSNIPSGKKDIILTNISISDGETTMQTDQTYSALSINAQSGIAVQQAISQAITPSE